MQRKRLKSLEDRVAYRINRGRQSVFVREDFADLAGYDQVGRALRILVGRQKLMKLGYGLYARTQVSSLSGKIIPEKPLPALAAEALDRLGIDRRTATNDKAAYDSGQTTQVPTGRVIAVRGRIARKIGYDGKYVSFEPARA